MLKKIILTSLIVLPTFTLANNSLNPVLQIGYDWGGTTLATVQHTYDPDQKINAGEGISFEVGAAVGNHNSNLELQFLVGYKIDQVTASNGEVTWDSIPFTALAIIKDNQWKFGAGITYHLNPELVGNFTGYDNNGNYFNDSADDEYENSLGGVLQIQYRATDSLSIGLKGTFIEYKLKNDPTVIAKGNSIGMNLTYTFGERSEFR